MGTNPAWLSYLQVDTSHCFNPPIDFDVKVAFQYKVLILKRNFKPGSKGGLKQRDVSSPHTKTLTEPLAVSGSTVRRLVGPPPGLRQVDAHHNGMITICSRGISGEGEFMVDETLQAGPFHWARDQH